MGCPTIRRDITTIGRFIQPDTITPNIYNPQDLNRYAYVKNNPVRYTDPTGHCEIDECPSTFNTWTASLNSSISQLSGAPESTQSPLQTNGKSQSSAISNLPLVPTPICRIPMACGVPTQTPTPTRAPTPKQSVMAPYPNQPWRVPWDDLLDQYKISGLGAGVSVNGNVGFYGWTAGLDYFSINTKPGDPDDKGITAYAGGGAQRKLGASAGPYLTVILNTDAINYQAPGDYYEYSVNLTSPIGVQIANTVPARTLPLWPGAVQSISIGPQAGADLGGGFYMIRVVPVPGLCGSWSCR